MGKQSPPRYPFSGNNFLKAACKIGYEKINQTGSHVKVRKYLDDGKNHTFSFPLHDELKLGLRESLIKEVEEYNPNIDFRSIVYGIKKRNVQ